MLQSRFNYKLFANALGELKIFSWAAKRLLIEGKSAFVRRRSVLGHQLARQLTSRVLCTCYKSSPTPHNTIIKRSLQTLSRRQSKLAPTSTSIGVVMVITRISRRIASCAAAENRLPH